MKKILLIISIAFCIFQMVVLATAIDIGGAATDRGNNYGPNYTYVDKNNPANDTGTITTLQIWAQANMTGMIVAIFEEVLANKFTVRDSEAIGSVTAGTMQEFEVSLDVAAGDFIGLFFDTGQIEYDSSGDGVWYSAGDNTSCVDLTFTLLGTRILSLYGIGTTEEEEEEEANAIFFGINF